MTQVWGTPISETGVKIPKTKALNVGDRVRSYTETKSMNLIGVTEKGVFDLVKSRLNEDYDIKLLYLKIEFYKPNVEGIAPIWGQIWGHIRTTIHYEVVNTSPIDPATVTAIIILAIAGVIVIETVLFMVEINWLIGKAIEIVEDVSDKVEEGLGLIFEPFGDVGLGLSKLGGAAPLMIPLGLIIIIILVILFIAYTATKGITK